MAQRTPSYDSVARLRELDRYRVADLLALRYERMLANPLAYYRGAALVMSDDLARGRSSSIEVQICGDAHLANFGVFSSPERELVFDVNDFDETDQGPFEWDVKRLAASLAIAAEQLGHDATHQATIVRDAARTYQRSMRLFAHETRLDVWYSTLDVESILRDLRGFFTDSALRQVDDVIRLAKGKDAQGLLQEMVTYTEFGPRIRARPPLVTPLHERPSGSLGTRDVIYRVLAGYAQTLSSDRQALLAQFTPVDAAHQVVGIGSVGTECFIILMVGRDDRDTFFLQVKEARPSVVSVARGLSPTTTPGARVVAGQKLMQASSDVFLGWHSLRTARSERGFYVRQLYNNKASVRVDQLNEAQLLAYGRVCAWTLARAHARSGQSAQIAGYLGQSESFARAMVSFAITYRDQNLVDFHALARAAALGHLPVSP